MTNDMFGTKKCVMATAPSGLNVSYAYGNRALPYLVAFAPAFAETATCRQAFRAICTNPGYE